MIDGHDAAPHQPDGPVVTRAQNRMQSAGKVLK